MRVGHRRIGEGEGISGAGYTASYTYDANGHVTSASVVNAGGAALANAAQGAWTYNTSAPDAIASIGSGDQAYSAAYDSTGDQTCRASGALTCANPMPTGESLTYDQLRRLVQWTNAAGTSSAQYAYDGEGARVWQQAASTVAGTTTTTTTSYVLGVQEWTSTAVTGQGTTTATTSLYALPGGAAATRDASGLTDVGGDAPGTAVAVLNATTMGVDQRGPGGGRVVASRRATSETRLVHGDFRSSANSLWQARSKGWVCGGARLSNGGTLPPFERRQTHLVWPATIHCMLKRGIVCVEGHPYWRAAKARQ